MIVWALVLAADMAAGEGPAKEPNRRWKINEMMGEEKRNRLGDAVSFFLFEEEVKGRLS